MGSAKVTLSDVAAGAGISVTTASFVPSGRRGMRISKGTQKRVHQAAHELSYVPRNPGSSALQVRAPTIGFISDTVGTEPFAGEMIRGCVTAATERSHALLMTETEGRRELEPSESRELVDRGVGRSLYASTATRLSDAMKANPQLRLLIGVGRRDLAVPQDSMRYSVDHLDIPASLRANISWAEYESGHMMYLLKADAEKLRADLAGFVKAGR